ncbi:hypothetical protein PQC39_gp002 [Vibrio phage Vp_R1]|uniref:Uncharacterized protein n=1 Tax=Vibrio phage Vp_R1 TaxID=2059867 RepID=A0A2H5BQE6_9CAUD|nr:hypothetical protein PQC39_gp002 [Vibrio phage Vp_R1]AUG88366.1 hypothetical protein VPR_002 [Vibrio phage Vp_R1]
MLVYTVIPKKLDKVQYDTNGQFMIFVNPIFAVKYMDRYGLSAEDYEVMPINMDVLSIGDTYD